tara:strand:- start:5408 stop:5845 length:438 start_codon:yes stop_codon:yes gene_type:complete
LSLDREINFLKKIGTEQVPHDRGRSLFTHLHGVYKLLESNGRPLHEQRAGLFHAIYGTEFFGVNLQVTREIVQKNIGEDAELIVWTFCNTDGQDRTIRFMGGVEFPEPLKTSLRWLDYCNTVEQHAADKNPIILNVFSLYESILY